MMEMEREVFEQLVADALDSLPEEFREKLDNVDVVVEDIPSPEQMRKMRLRHEMSLYGLYEGVPQTKRRNYAFVLPDKITIFKKAIETWNPTVEAIKEQVRRTVLHEIGHHFGMSDAQLRKLHY